MPSGYPTTHEIGIPRDLTRDDMTRLFDGAFRPAPITNLRDSHHRVARLVASGLRPSEVVERTGYSPQRIYTLSQSPAFQDLVAQYRCEVDAAFIRQQDEYYARGIANMKIAEDILGDRLAQEVNRLDAGEEPTITIKDLVAVTSDRADRFGYPKHTQNTNLNTNWAEMLEHANARSKRALLPRSEEADA